MHTAEYVEAFTSGALDEARVKRIGFGPDVTRSPVLINRTLAEVAGGLRGLSSMPRMALEEILHTVGRREKCPTCPQSSQTL